MARSVLERATGGGGLIMKTGARAMLELAVGATGSPRQEQTSSDFVHLPTSPLARLDAVCLDAHASGALILTGAVEILTAAVNHAHRRVRASGRRILRVSPSLVDEPLLELATQLGVSADGEPVAVASAILASAQSAVLLIEGCGPSDWGREVAQKLIRGASNSPALVVMCEPASEDAGVTGAGNPTGVEGRSVHVGAALVAGDVARYLRAVADDVEHLPARAIDRLDVLDRWWTTAACTPLDATRPALSLSREATQLARRISLARRSLRMDQVLALGARTAADELVRESVVTTDDAGRFALNPLVVIGAPWQTPSAQCTLVDTKEQSDASRVAELLERDGSDPWALARAAELTSGHHDASNDDASKHTLFERALSAADEPRVRDHIWSRWMKWLEQHDESGEASLRAAGHALRVGDADRALVLARIASTRRDGFDVLLVLGRAFCARGELRHASLSLHRAIELLPECPRGERAECQTGERASALVELAEVAFLEGRHADVETLASEALEDAASRLAARNLLGKLLLARAKWTEAEQHFAEDAWDAARSQDSVAELRARVNGAIALLSNGRRDEARAALTAVLEDARTHSELPAVGYALTNLATLAILGHDYAEALRLTEEACSVRRRLGDRIRLSLLIANLAELRLRLGLVTEAEHALRFGRRACAGSLPGSRFPQFALLAARIHLTRGRTIEASSELKAALACSGSSNGAQLAECHRVAVRIALENGDLERAETALALVDKHGTTGESRADAALLRALLERARGDDYELVAERSLTLAREAEDVEIAREAHLLLFHAANGSDRRRAARHLDAALSLRDRVADSLPDNLRQSYLARPEVLALSALRAPDAEASSPAPPESQGSSNSCPDTLRQGERGQAGSRPSRPAKTPAPKASAMDRMVGSHTQVLALRRCIERVAATDAIVLIHGESGTGKELVAEAIHEASPRSAGPMVKVNCAALVETLLLSELFGHEKGAFTGASARRRGRFEMADGGTLFLDEIGDISPRTQVALLRVLQEKTFERVGGATPLHADVRVVCATNRDLRELVRRGEFREDLYYRLRGFVLDVPALRQRISDLPAIAEGVLQGISRERGEPTKQLSVDARTVMLRYGWPGNIRELENVLRAATVFAEGEFIEPRDFDSHLDRMQSGRDGNEQSGAPSSRQQVDATEATYAEVRGGVSLGDMKRKLERECIIRALDESGGNITRAAALLGMKRPRLSQLVKQHGLRASEETAQ